MPYRHRASYGRRNYGVNRYNGAIASRLRSAYSTLARADHDYKGHRVQAMRSVRSAIRSLSYSSSRGYGMSMTGFQRNNLTGNGNLNLKGNGGRRQGQRLTQAQSDSLMRRAGHTLQLVSSHIANQGGNSRTNRAYGHVNRALQHVTVALNVR